MLNYHYLYNDIYKIENLEVITLSNSLITVIMSVYKESMLELEQSINSILNQSYSNIEFIIVIDNPLEKWRIDFIKKIKDSRIKILINRQNIGLPKSLNRAIKEAKGRYIARMDADDISAPNRLELQLKYLIENDIDICGSYVNWIYHNKIVKKGCFPTTHKGIHKMLYLKNCIAHPTYFLKKEVYEKLNGYKNIYTCEDYEFLLRADRYNFRMGNIPKALLNYRLTDNSISRSNPGKQVLISNYIKKWYKKRPNEIDTKDIDRYLNSKEYLSKISKYDAYWKIRNIRNSKRNNIAWYLYYSFKSLIYFRIFVDELKIKINELIIKKVEQHETKNKKIFK